MPLGGSEPSSVITRPHVSAPVAVGVGVSFHIMGIGRDTERQPLTDHAPMPDA